MLQFSGGEPCGQPCVGDCALTPTGQGGPGGSFVIYPAPVSYGTSSPCDPCAKAIIDCAIGYTPAGCIYGVRD